LMLWLGFWALLALVLLVCRGAIAEEYQIRPEAAVAIGDAIDAGNPNAATACWVHDGADELDPETHRACVPISEGGTSRLVIQVPFGGGDIRARAIVINADGRVSGPSVDVIVVHDIPQAPTFLPSVPEDPDSSSLLDALGLLLNTE